MADDGQVASDSTPFRELLDERGHTIHGFAAFLKRRWHSAARQRVAAPTASLSLGQLSPEPELEMPGSELVVNASAIRNHAIKERPARTEPTKRWLCFALVTLNATPPEVREVLRQVGCTDIHRLKDTLATVEDRYKIWTWPTWQTVQGPDLVNSLQLVEISQAAAPKNGARSAIVLPTVALSGRQRKEIERLHASADQDHRADDATTYKSLLEMGQGFHSRHDMLLCGDLSRLFDRAGMEPPIVVKDQSLRSAISRDVPAPGVAFTDADGISYELDRIISVGLLTNAFTMMLWGELQRTSDPLVSGQIGEWLFDESTEELRGMIAHLTYRGVKTTLIGGAKVLGTARLGSFVSDPQLWLEDIDHLSEANLLTRSRFQGIAHLVQLPGHGRRNERGDYRLVDSVVFLNGS